jgi:cytochrome c peroxidase
MKKIFVLWPAAGLLVLLLSGCGGGGANSAAAPAALALPATPAEAGASAAAETAAESAKALAQPAADAVAPPDQGLSNLALLGKRIFTDTNLSEPRGTACVSCHQAALGFAGNNGGGSTARGSLGLLGLRSAMTNAYTGLVPTFSFRTEGGETEAVGGHFWDGRAGTLALQALMPFLNPLEMNNADGPAVIRKIAAASYAPQFRQVFGANVFSDPQAAYAKIGEAIEAFERSAQLQAFSSKYDAMVRGQAQFSPAESRGMALFTDAKRANCAGCHLMNAASGKPEDSPFSEFTYYATGVPRNRAIAQNANPNFFDLGLCGPERSKPALPADVPADITIENFCGKFRMPTLRNVAERPVYMHNGVFKDLREVVRFYSTRISNPERIYGGALPNDLPAAYLDNIEKIKPPFNRSRADGPVLSEAEITDLLSFLRTLSDGYTPPPAPAASPAPAAPAPGPMPGPVRVAAAAPNVPPAQAPQQAAPPR